MATRAQKIRLGIFMLLAFLLLVGTVGTLAGLQMWNPRNIYFARYRESVSGLEIGSSVKMKGVRVGRVDAVKVTPDAEMVEVTFALDPSAPVTVDTEAVVMSIGITGLKFIELTGGTAKSKALPPNTKKSQIKAGASMMQTLTGKATKISEKMEAVLNNMLVVTGEANRTRLAKLLDSSTRLATNYADLAEDNRKRLKRVLFNLDKATAAMEKTSKQVSTLVVDIKPNIKATLAASSSAAYSLNRAMSKLRPQATLNEITRAAKALRHRIDDPAITSALNALKTSAAQAGQLTRNLSTVVTRSSRQVGRILTHFTSTSKNFRAFSRSIRERPSLLLGGETLKERKIR